MTTPPGTATPKPPPATKPICFIRANPVKTKSVLTGLWGPSTPTLSSYQRDRAENNPPHLCRLLLFIVLLAVPDLASANPVKTHPSHLGPSNDPGGFAPSPVPGYSSNLVGWFLGPPNHVTRREDQLTRACREKEFNQRIPGFHRATFRHPGGKIQALGWVRAGSRNLHDPDERAQPATNYYFHRDRTSKCLVYSLRDDEIPRLIPEAPATETLTTTGN